MKNIADSPDMTISTCIALAAARGYLYAALQDGSLCSGSNAIGSDQIMSTECVESCAGAVNEVCGGTCARDVYTIPTPGDACLR
jgi:hypothetical protein